MDAAVGSAVPIACRKFPSDADASSAACVVIPIDCSASSAQSLTVTAEVLNIGIACMRFLKVRRRVDGPAHGIDGHADTLREKAEAGYPCAQPTPCRTEVLTFDWKVTGRWSRCPSGWSGPGPVPG